MYKISILSDEEFEALPYPETEISLGIADPVKNQVFVRETGAPELNQYLINHELEHLIEAEDVHYRHGVYYKGAGNLFQPIASGIGSAVQGAGNLFGTAAKGIGQAASGIGRGLGSFSSALSKGISSTGGNFFQGVQNLGQKAGQGFSSLLNKFSAGVSPQLSPSQLAGGLSAQAVNNPALRAPADFFKTATNFATQALPQASQILQQVANAPKTGPGVTVKGPGGSQIFGRSADPTSSILGQFTAGSPPSPGGPGQGGGVFQQILSALGGGQNATSQAEQILNPLQTLVGLGSLGAGELFAPDVGVPDFSSLPSFQALRNFQPGEFQDFPGDVEQAILDDLDSIEAEEFDFLRDQYKNLRPGTDISTDSAFRRDVFQLQEMQGRRRSAALATARFQFMQINLQANELEMQQLMQIANLDISQIMLQLGLDSQEASDFKRLFSDIGSAFLNAGLGQNA